MTITRAFILACRDWTDAIARARADYLELRRRISDYERSTRA